MGISSLGVGSNILTQDVLDQLRAADEAQYVKPVDASISEQKSKEDAFNIVDALMDNVYQSLKSLDEYGVFESRVATASNDSVVGVSASDSSDIQNFTLDVANLATKEIEQSGSFTSNTDTIATGSGTMELSVGANKFTIDYDATTTLDELKDLINKTAGSSVDATIVQIASGDYRLFLSADETGTGQNISITDVVGAGENLKAALTTDMSNVQTAVDANFKFNGLNITRTSNTVDDLLSGVTLTLKGTGVSDVSVKQDRDNIESKITNFIDKYNSALFQLDTDTKSSQDASERGVFSSDSTIKSMRASLKNIISTVGEGSGRLQDYGIDVDDSGRLSLDSSKLNTKLDENPDNVKSFLTGGTFTKSDGSTVELKGAFVEIEDEVAKYSKYNAVLDQYKNSITDRITALNEQRDKAIERLDDRYATMAKRFAAYDLMISKLNSASSMFVEMANAQTAAQQSLN